jgi:hypothetical protein
MVNQVSAEVRKRSIMTEMFLHIFKKKQVVLNRRAESIGALLFLPHFRRGCGDKQGPIPDACLFNTQLPTPATVVSD